LNLNFVLRWIVTLLALIAAGTAADSARADAARDARLRERLKANVLRWGGDIEGGGPYMFRDPAMPDRIVGFEVELVEALVKRLQTQLGLPQLRDEFVHYEWSSLPLGLEKRDFDILVNGMEITHENIAKLAFSRPYYLFAQQLTVRSDETRINNLADCHDRPVGTLAGSAAYHLLEASGATQIVGYEGQVEPYQELKLKRLDAVLLDVPIAVYHAGSDPHYRHVPTLIGWGGYGIAARQDDADLVAALDEAIAALHADGTLEAIYRRWKLWNDEQRELGTLGSPEKLLSWAAAKNGTTEEAAAEWTFARYAPLLVRAAGVTVGLTIVSMAVAMFIGLVVAVCRLYGPPPVRWLALAYVEFFRGIPLLLLLTFLYYGLPSLGIDLKAYQAAILGFGLNYAAFEAEIYRSSILAVPKGQWEAAHALGMEDVTAFRRIIFPQAIRTALGPMTNDFVAMFKDTSLVSVIAVVELTKQYQILARSSLKFVEIGLLTAALYLAMSVPLGYLARYLEEHWSAGHK
jgi:polar amino acid transport system substrate-binding protein